MRSESLGRVHSWRVTFPITRKVGNGCSRKCQCLLTVSSPRSLPLGVLGDNCLMSSSISRITVFVSVEILPEKACYGYIHLEKIAFCDGSLDRSIGEICFEGFLKLEVLSLPKGYVSPRSPLVEQRFITKLVSAVITVLVHA